MILPSKGSPNPQRSVNAENKEAFNAGVNNSAGSAKNDKNKSKLHNIMYNFCQLFLHSCSSELKAIQSLNNTLLESATYY